MAARIGEPTIGVHRGTTVTAGSGGRLDNALAEAVVARVPSSRALRILARAVAG